MDLLQVHRKALSNPFSVPVEEDWGRGKHATNQGKRRDAPAISDLLEECWREQRHDAADHRAENCACSNCRCGILLKCVDIVVLYRVGDHDLANAIEEGANGGGDPVGVSLDRPRKPVRC